MRFKMSRLCELAGVPYSSRRGGLLRENKEEKEKEEGMYHEADEEKEKEEMLHYEADEDEEDQNEFMDFNKNHGGKDEGMYHEGMYEDDDVDYDDDDQNEMVEVDEAMLVQELRRARRIMQEGKRKAAARKHRRRQSLQESQLKAVIDQEVKNIIKEMDLNLNSSWMYGKRKPKRSRNGYTHQGSFLKGLGFK